MSIYVYAADRIRPWMRILSVSLVAFGAMASAVLITNLHAFEGTPADFRMENGTIVDVDPWAAFFNLSFFVTAGHVALSEYMTGAFVIASVAAYKMLKEPFGTKVYHFHKIGSFLILLSLLAFVWNKFFKKDSFPKWLMWLFFTSGPLSLLGIEFGWIFACTGRQPWTIYRMLSTEDSITTTGNLGILFILFVLVYIILGLAVVLVLLYYWLFSYTLWLFHLIFD